MASQQGRGRKRKYCSSSCKQRAYEHRNNLSASGLPQDAVILRAERVEELRDKLYELRCAAEDIATAQAEGGDHTEISALCQELVGMARQVERLR